MTASGKTLPTLLIAHPSADMYGSDRVMLETVDAMTSRGWRVIVTVPSTGPLIAELDRRGVQVEFRVTPVLSKAMLKPSNLLRTIVTAMKSIPQGIGVIRGHQADLVYVSTLTIPMWLVLATLLRRPVVCHVHESERTARRVVRQALAAPLFLADALLVNSQYSRKVLADSFPRLDRKSEVIYNAVPGPPQPNQARGRLDQPIRLTFVGRLSPRKGPQVAVELVQALARRGVEARLDLLGAVFPGYEWFETELRDQVRIAGLTDVVTFHGFVSDIWDQLERADIALVPSQGDEPFGNTAVEAVLAARPVIASAASGLDEAVAGYSSAQSVAADDVEAWADAVVRVVDQWPTFRRDALSDSVVAQERHDPERYRAEVARRLETLTRQGSRRQSSLHE